MNCLQQLGTNSSYTYIDTRTIYLVGGSHAATLGGTAVIKRVGGVSIKSVFFGIWEKQPETRCPRQLDNLWSVCYLLVYHEC